MHENHLKSREKKLLLDYICLTFKKNCTKKHLNLKMYVYSVCIAVVVRK